MIPRDTVERIFSTARIEEVVSDFITLKKRGANLIGLCPFHQEKTGSFTVSPAKGIYKCFGCGKSGHVAGFVMEIEQCSYVEALRWLAKKYHIEIEERELTAEEQQKQDDRESMFVVNDFALHWFEDQLWNTPEGTAIGLAYFRQRGLTDDMIRRFHLGYSPDKSLFYTAAKEKGFDDKYLLNDAEHAPFVGTGLCCASSQDGRFFDRFHSRVMFPFFSRSGKVVGFAGRIMKQNDKVGKYVNSPTSPIFEKHDQLYGLFQAKQAISRLNYCYLVEGQMDVISLHQAGIENVVASGGTSLTAEQIRLMHHFTDNITILYDGDKAGIKATLRGIDMVLSEGINVRVVSLPEGEDPDSFARSHNASDVIDFLENNKVDFIRFKTQLLLSEAAQDPAQRSEVIHSIVQSISVIPDAITRQVYIKDTAQRLSMTEAILSREVAGARRKDADKETQQIKSNPAPIVQQPIAKNNDTFTRNMLNILRLIVRYGEQTLYEDDQQQPVRVGEYIISNLREDEIAPRHPLHQRILDEYMAHYQEPDFVAEKFFSFHEDPEISQLAIALIANRYQLSRIFQRQSISENVVQEVQQKTDADILPELTGKLLLEIKFTVVEERIEALSNELKIAEENHDDALMITLLSTQKQLISIRAQLCKALGNRIIV